MNRLTIFLMTILYTCSAPLWAQEYVFYQHAKTNTSLLGNEEVRTIELKITLLEDGLVVIEQDTISNAGPGVTDDARLILINGFVTDPQGRVVLPDTLENGYSYYIMPMFGTPYQADFTGVNYTELSCGCDMPMSPPVGCEPIKTNGITRCEDPSNECDYCIGWVKQSRVGIGMVGYENSMLFFKAKQLEYHTFYED